MITVETKGIEAACKAAHESGIADGIRQAREAVAGMRTNARVLSKDQWDMLDKTITEALAAIDAVEGE